MHRILLLPLLALALAGCGSDDDPAPATAGGGGEAAFPVVIEHALGSTTIPERPERVVVVGYSDQDVLLALGVRPVGAMDWFGQDTFEGWEWQQDAWGGEYADIVSSNNYDIDFEKVAAARPDLILGLYQELKKGDYDKLSKIAPTVAQAKGQAYTTPWRAMTRTAAKALGRSAEAEKLIAAVDARFARFREDHPELQGKTAVIADAGEAPDKYHPFASGDQRGQFLRELGFAPSKRIDELAGKTFSAEVSRERVDLLDVDRLFLLVDPPADRRIEGDELFGRLGVAKRGGVVNLPYYSGDHVGAAVAFNSVLSLPYAVDGVERALTAGAPAG